MEDDLFFFEKLEWQPQKKMKMEDDFKKKEDYLNNLIFLNGRRPQKKNENRRQPQYFLKQEWQTQHKLEDDPKKRKWKTT